MCFRTLSPLVFRSHAIIAKLRSGTAGILTEVKGILVKMVYSLSVGTPNAQFYFTSCSCIIISFVFKYQYVINVISCCKGVGNGKMTLFIFHGYE